jgi:hypothetical protein
MTGIVRFHRDGLVAERTKSALGPRAGRFVSGQEGCRREVGRESDRPQRYARCRPRCCWCVGFIQSCCITTKRGTLRFDKPVAVGTKLGVYDGSSAIETFLARFEKCSDYFK